MLLEQLPENFLDSCLGGIAFFHDHKGDMIDTGPSRRPARPSGFGLPRGWQPPQRTSTGPGSLAMPPASRTCRGRILRCNAPPCYKLFNPMTITTWALFWIFFGRTHMNTQSSRSQLTIPWTIAGANALEGCLQCHEARIREIMPHELATCRRVHLNS